MESTRIENAVRELTHGMTMATYKSMQHMMKHCVETPNSGLLLAPTGIWSGKADKELIIKGMSDTTYTSNYDTCHSVMGQTTFLNDSPVIMQSNMHRITDLSVTESELGGATEIKQDILFVMHVLESMGLESMGLLVKKPMVLYVDNNRANDFANNWSIGGCTRHVKVHQCFLCKLKDLGIINCVWIAGTMMSSKNEIRNIQVEEGDRHEMTPPWYLDVHKAHNDQDLTKNSKEVYGM
jgi:hypothetical protein